MQGLDFVARGKVCDLYNRHTTSFWRWNNVIVCNVLLTLDLRLKVSSVYWDVFNPLSAKRWVIFSCKFDLFIALDPKKGT